jgi:anti-sigma-K factor RskA
VVKTSPDDLHLLAGSYALDALSAADRATFERHLEHCASCEAEVRGFRETAARLALARTTEPPPAMREQVLAAAYRTRQLPPLAGDEPDRAARRGRLRSVAFPSGLRQSPGPASHRRARRVPRVLIGAVAACAAAGLAFGIVSQVSTTPQPPAAISSVLRASDAHSQTVRSATGGTLTAVVSWDKREAVVTTANMASLPSQQVYQLWVMGPAGTTTARSVGLLPRAGQAGPVLAAALKPGDRIGITVEPAGGTAQPTSSPVAIMTLPV